jgi:hypothetical protein
MKEKQNKYPDIVSVRGWPPLTLSGPFAIRGKGIVTERDLIALQWICEQGTMTVDQLWRTAWWNDQSRGPRYAYERVLFLERASFLEKVKTQYSLKSYFKARKRACNLLSTKGEGGYRYILTQRTPLNETLHVDGLTEWTSSPP